MAKRLFDTSVLVRQWRRRSAQDANPNNASVTRWAEELTGLHGTSAIVSPVVIEFLAGTSSADELKLARAYLDVFDVIDQKHIPPQDWQEAKRSACRSEFLATAGADNWETA